MPELCPWLALRTVPLHCDGLFEDGGRLSDGEDKAGIMAHTYDTVGSGIQVFSIIYCIYIKKTHNFGK